MPKYTFAAFLLFTFYFPSNHCLAQSQDIEYSIEYGSAIIGVVKTDSVWIVADSRLTGPDSTYLKTKKLYNIKGVSFGFTGLGNIVDKKTKEVVFSPGELMKMVIKRRNINIDTLLKQYVVNVNNQFRLLCKTYPNFYYPDIILEAGFIIVMNNGRPSLRHFKLKRDENCNVSLYDLLINKNSDPKSFVTFVLGHTEYIEEYLNTHYKYLESDTKEKLVCLIKKQSETQITVGMPADVLLLYKNKHKWFHGEECNFTE